jgi:hypothetical protein
MNQTLAQIDDMLVKLTLEEQLLVFERLAQQLRQTLQTQKKPQDLYGIWRDRFPANVDLDEVLQDIRQGWQDNIV